MFRLIQRFALPILALLLAILGTIGIRPFGLHYSDSQLIIALLGLLAIEAFSERMDLISSMSQRIEAIYSRVSSVDAVGIDFLRRIEQEKVSEIIRSARRSIWIAGPSLDTIVQCQDDLRAQLMNNREVRILMVDATPRLIDWYGKHVIGATYSLNDDRGRARAKERLDDNRERLLALKALAPNRYAMRVLERILWFGFIIIDAGLEQQRMDVQIYLYKTSVEIAPILKFSNKSDPKWMNTFLDQYLLYWEEATELTLPIEAAEE